MAGGGDGERGGGDCEAVPEVVEVKPVVEDLALPGYPPPGLLLLFLLPILSEQLLVCLSLGIVLSVLLLSGFLIFVFLLFVANAFGFNRFLCFQHTFILYKLIRVIFFAGNIADQTGFFRHIALLTLPSSLLTIINNIRLVSETQVQHFGCGIDRPKEEEDRQCGKKSGSEVEVVPDTPQTFPIRFFQNPQVLAARRSADHHKIG